ncbi:hypothetical protein AMTR_s04861p00007070, partial [Amborella trichopoda]
MEIEEDDEDDSVAVEKGVQEDLEGSQEEESNFYPTMALAAVEEATPLSSIRLDEANPPLLSGGGPFVAIEQDGPHIATMVAAIANDMGMDVNIPTG